MKRRMLSVWGTRLEHKDLDYWLKIYLVTLHVHGEPVKLESKEICRAWFSIALLALTPVQSKCKMLLFCFGNISDPLCTVRDGTKCRAMEMQVDQVSGSHGCLVLEELSALHSQLVRLTHIIKFLGSTIHSPPTSHCMVLKMLQSVDHHEWIYGLWCENHWSWQTTGSSKKNNKNGSRRIVVGGIEELCITQLRDKWVGTWKVYTNIWRI